MKHQSQIDPGDKDPLKTPDIYEWAISVASK